MYPETHAKLFYIYLVESYNPINNHNQFSLQNNSLHVHSQTISKALEESPIGSIPETVSMKAAEKVNNILHKKHFCQNCF